jgi:hypothetical protein
MVVMLMLLPPTEDTLLEKQQFIEANEGLS